MSTSTYSDPRSIVAPDAKLEKLADGFSFTEGPAGDRDGNVFFTDQPNDRIMKWSVDGKLTTFMQPCGRCNGMFFDSLGNLWACADEHCELWKIDARGGHVLVVKDFDGKLLNGPNDVWVRPDFGAYLTDPFYRRPYWDHTEVPQDCQAVYYLPPGGSSLVRVADDLNQPNGIVGTPDGKTLYVADIRAGETFAYDIQADGALVNKRLFCKLGSDGMTIDNEGNVYLTGHGVTVFDNRGLQILHIPVDEAWCGNICFGGSAHDLLFITASKGIYGLKMRVHGYCP
jgi:gluconolactonase